MIGNDTEYNLGQEMIWNNSKDVLKNYDIIWDYFDISLMFYLQATMSSSNI